MTPLHLEILMHYFISMFDHPKLDNDTYKEYAQHLSEYGLLFTPSADKSSATYEITKHGKKTVENLLSWLGEKVG